jgi:hypothetical protein
LCVSHGLGSIEDVSLRVKTWGLTAVVAGILLLAGIANADPTYPVKVGPTGRYLVDQNGVPFLMTGESPQSMIGNLSEAEAELFFINRRSHGFNTVLIDLLCAEYTGCRTDGTTFDGIRPFLATLPGSPGPRGTTVYDLTQPNPDYFARADAIIQLAAQYGFLVMFDPIETGSWLEVLQANGTTRARTFGRFVGERYKNVANIVWFHGNDYGPPHFALSPANDDLVTAVALGIKDNGDSHLQTVLFNTNTNLPPVLSSDNSRWLPIIDLNAAYTYQATYFEVLHGYNFSPPMPVFVGETGYEFEDLAVFGSAPRNLRAQQYWTLLSGATGQLYGNHFTWPFLNGWQNQLDSPGAVQMAHLVALFSPRRWYDLVPDQHHTFVTAGYGTFEQQDYVTAARTSDGAQGTSTLGMAYVPSARMLTVNMSKMAGSTTARWYDPANGTFTTISGSPFANTGSRQFTTPASNADGDDDWVLVLEATAGPSTPTISSITPSQVNVGGPDFTLTVTGTHFDATSVIRVNGNDRSTTFVPTNKLTTTISASEITVAGTFSISVFTPGATASNAATLSIRNPMPSMSAIHPTRRLMGGPDLSLTVTGANFVSGSMVRWKGSDRPTSFVSPTELHAGISASDLAAAGTAAVTVFNPLPGGGTSTPATFTMDAPGRVAFASATATVNETAPSVTLTVNRTVGVGGPVMVGYATADGTAFAGTDYDARQGTLTFATLETTKTIVVPIRFNAGGGNKTFTVTLGNAQSGLTVITPGTVTITVVNVTSTLTSFTPALGPVGTVITITGTNLTLATGARIGGVDTSGITIMSPTSIRTTVPSGATTGPVGVVSPAGSPTSTGVFKVTPRITSVSPDDGIADTPVTIVGTRFTGAIAVKFGSVAATSFTVSVDGNSITTTVPAAAITAPLTVTTPGGTAISPAPFVVIKAPTISSFTPVAAAEGALVTINGTNLASVTDVSFNGLAAGPVTVVSATSIRVAVPTGATTGRLGVTKPAAGPATSAADFRVAPRIVSITPAQATPGAAVTITGATFTGATAVKFGGVAQPIFTVVNGTTITTTVPTTAITGRITVTTPAGTATSPADFLVIRAPTISSFTPIAGPIGSAVTITGTNLASVTSVSFNGAAASSVTVLSATLLRVVVPTSATSGKITVVDPAAPATSTGTFSVTPSIDGFQPSRGVTGTIVTITGKAFTGATAVRFGAAMAANVLLDGPTQIRATVPPTAITGPVTVTAPPGAGISAAAFTVVRAPTITSVSPARGAIGSAVTLSGANLGSVTAVDFNGTSVSGITVLSATSVRVVVPAGASTGRIHVSNEAANNVASPTDFILTPQLVSMSPDRGLPGDTVVLTGTNFTGATLVRFGSVPAATPVQVDSSGTQITTQVPTNALTAKISVTTPTGTTTATTNFVVIRPPTLTSFTPASGPEGTLVTLSGANIAGVNQVAFGAANATSITVLSATMVRVVVPPGATTAKIAIADEVGSGQSAATFTVTPRILTIPAAGLPGASVTITGTSLTNASAVRFGGIAATTFNVDGPMQITATVPSNGVSGKIIVTTPGGTATSPTDFTVIRPPTVTSFTPASGQVGTLVTLNGANLGTVTAVTFGNVSVTAPITVLSATSIRVTVPAGALTGRISVTNPAATAQSATNFTAVPRVTGFSLPSGSDDMVISILGTSLTGVTAVKFGTVSAAFTFVSDSEISAIVPAAAVTGRVSVTTPGGTATSPSDFVITAAIF